MPVGGRWGGGGACRGAVVGGVPVERRLPGELLAAGRTPVADGLVLRRHVHVSPARRPEVFAAPPARERLGVVVDRLDVSGDVGGSSEGLGTNLALVLGRVVLGLAVKCQARLALVRLSARQTLHE